MELFNNEQLEQIKKMFNGVKKKIKILKFTQRIETPNCKILSEFLNQISNLSEKIEIINYDFEYDKEEKLKYDIDHIPSMVILGENDDDFGIRFYGTPIGYQLNSFINILIELSGTLNFSDLDLLNRIKKIDKKIDLKVFIELESPKSPEVVMNCHKLALLNKNIKATMIDCGTFPTLINKYGVRNIPKLVINETYELSGGKSINQIVELIESVE